MTTIFSHLGVGDTDRGFISNIGRDVIYDIIMDKVNAETVEIMAVESVFVEELTDKYQERYKLTATGRLQKVRDGAKPARTRVAGYWDVAYPLEGNQDSLAITRVAEAYMTPAEMEKEIDSVIQLDINSRRYEIQRALFNNVNASWTDDNHGDLTLRRLANTDGTLYPPVLGSDTEAEENHYLVSGYVSADIDDTNNPYLTLAHELTEHFGRTTGGENVVSFINSSEQSVTEFLTNFVEVQDRYVSPGDDADIPDPGVPGPGQYIGRVVGYSHVKIWDWIPANYILSVYLDAPKPLKQRIDPQDTGLTPGLQLVSREFSMPMNEWYWDDRFGFAVGNRLNGAIMQLKAAGNYDIPSQFA
jgi:hypothetical protein